MYAFKQDRKKAAYQIAPMEDDFAGMNAWNYQVGSGRKQLIFWIVGKTFKVVASKGAVIRETVDFVSGVVEAVLVGGELVVLEQQTVMIVFGSLSKEMKVLRLRVEKGWISEHNKFDVAEKIASVVEEAEEAEGREEEAGKDDGSDAPSSTNTNCPGTDAVTSQLDPEALSCSPGAVTVEEGGGGDDFDDFDDLVKSIEM